jgi:hypothetical protein
LPARSLYDSLDVGIADLVHLIFIDHFDLQIIQVVLQVKTPAAPKPGDLPNSLGFKQLARRLHGCSLAPRLASGLLAATAVMRIS